MHEFDAGDRNRRVPKSLEAEHWTQTKLDGSMVLFNQIIEVFRRSQLGPIAASMCGEELPGRSVRSLIAIERDGARQPALALKRPPKEGFRGSDIPLGAQQEIDGLSIAVDGAIEVSPATLDLHVSFIDAP